MSENMVERVKLAMKPLVNEDMDADMRDAWLEDLARAAIEATIAFLVEQGTASRQTIRDLEAALKP